MEDWSKKQQHPNTCWRWIIETHRVSRAVRRLRVPPTAAPLVPSWPIPNVQIAPPRCSFFKGGGGPVALNGRANEIQMSLCSIRRHVRYTASAGRRRPVLGWCVYFSRLCWAVLKTERGATPRCGLGILSPTRDANILDDLITLLPKYWCISWISPDDTNPVPFRPVPNGCCINWSCRL